MKKISSLIVVFILGLALMLPMSAKAATASARLTGPGTVRAGDTITLEFKLNGTGLYGMSGTLSYDSNQVTLTNSSKKIASPWVLEANGNTFVAYDNELSSPINSEKTLFSVTFKVKNLATGTNIRISFDDTKATDGKKGTNLGTVSYTATIAAPKSTNNNLASLTVGNATISPAFSAGTTSYTASVPFSVSKLNVSATAADGKAKVSINSPNLTPNGTTKVTVTVTAENGAKKTYTINVARAQDPNYQASSNNNLSGITVDGFLLSPGFNTDTTKYIVWAPYETASVTVRGTAADSKASVEVVGGENLVAGADNTVKVVCTAENGSKKEYTIIVKRAAAHDGTVEEPGQTTPPEQAPSDDIPTNTQPVEKANGIVWCLLVTGVAGFAIGLAVGFVVKGSKKKES